MNKIFGIALALLVAFTSVILSNDASARDHTKSKYVCPACSMTADKVGECPMDHEKLVKVGDYYCKMDKTTSHKAGKCGKCGMKMTKMTAPAKGKM